MTFLNFWGLSGNFSAMNGIQETPLFPNPAVHPRVYSVVKGEKQRKHIQYMSSFVAVYYISNDR